MKKALLILVIILCSAQLHSAEQLVKFYLQDGSTKQYNISEIDNMKFSSAPDTLQLQVFTNKDSTYYYPAQLIDSVKFAQDSIQNQHIQFWHDGFKWDFGLHEIDSILIYYTKYVAVTIGSQVWMLKNLNVDHYRNGDSIPEVRDPWKWSNLTTGALCYYNNDPAMGAIYGKLYNWFAVNDPRGLAPNGWHVSSDAEWIKFSEILGGLSVGSKLKSNGTKESGTGLWRSPNKGATNESGFSALPDGYRNYYGIFRSNGDLGNWWSSTRGNAEHAWYRSLNYDYTYTDRYSGFYGFGYSVRCIKD